jgi:NAD(P)-dependent dehydrogenase (short-subunit alcohol dehydrogenase family)
MADLGYDDKVAIVTGAGGGLGRQHALLLASRGALVVVNDVGGAVDGTGTDAGPGQRVVDEIRAAGGEAVLDTNSVATPEGGAAIVQTALDAYEHIDIVVNNAGILRDKSFHKMTPDLVDPVIDVHLRGAFHVTQPAWVHMRERGYGRVVMTASSAGLFGNFGQANYGAAKMGLVGLAHVLAQEGRTSNILVNAIAPTAGTRMTRDIFGDELADKLAPALVSPLVAWLVHEDCPVTGHTYSVGGGRIARVFVAQGPGYLDPSTPLTVETVRDHFDEIDRTDDYTLLENATDEVRVLFELLG